MQRLLEREMWFAGDVVACRESFLDSRKLMKLTCARKKSAGKVVVKQVRAVVISHKTESIFIVTFDEESCQNRVRVQNHHDPNTRSHVNSKL